MTSSDACSFPDDLLKLQEQLHRAHAEHRAFLAGLPWSVEPMTGWAAGERYSHRGDVPDSPGWSQEEKETADRMWREIRELSIAVVDHPYWSTLQKEDVVAARMELKNQTRPTVVPASPEAA
ncbi:hypothetical protein [Streptomyces subrutilus]|uniref:Nucleic acid-binding protein n=1 Tax=Streptomyces subrutilus TaxID=36818 RepID=A0A1E5P075_9ACTN|nr:hypothetical protein [Streptomyces subrutilus]OEJ22467.1 hypothetical protein BGK67_33590 [Streptomyces subrutilus]